MVTVSTTACCRHQALNVQMWVHTLGVVYSFLAQELVSAANSYHHVL